MLHNSLKRPVPGITWEKRKSELKNSKGEIIFVQDTVIVPSDWSEISSDILAQKYFRKNGIQYDKRNSWNDYINGLSRPERGTSCDLFEIDLDPNTQEIGEYDARQVFHCLAYTWMHWGMVHY